LDKTLEAQKKEKMRKPRNLSGVYFRYQNPETDKWENWCFEDLPEKEQHKKMEDREIEWVKSLITHMWDTFNKLIDFLTEDNPNLKAIANEQNEEVKKSSYDVLMISDDLEFLKSKAIEYAKIVAEVGDEYGIGIQGDEEETD
jgi:hypothetical protein